MKEQKDGNTGYTWSSLPRFQPSKAPKTKWLWENFLPERAIAIVVGDAGTFKSTFLEALCKAISQGEDFLGRPTKKRRALYLDNENPPDVLANRDKAMKLGLEANERFILWSMYGRRPVPRIGSHALREIVRKSVDEGCNPLLIFDHWATFLNPGEGGETTGQTTPLLQELKRLCALGATVVVVVHTVKYDKTMFYGSQDLLNKADAMHTFVLNEQNGRRLIHVESFLKRHGTKRRFSVVPVIEKIDGKKEVTGFRPLRDGKQERKIQIERMRGIIKKHPNKSQRALAEIGAKLLGIGRNKVERLLNKYTGKYWKVRDGLNNKKTYVLRNSREA